MRTVARAVRHGALTRSEVPEQLWRELDKRLAQPDETRLSVFTDKELFYGFLSVISGIAWAGFLVWAVAADGPPRKLGGNIALVAVLVIGGAETAWSARHWRRERAEMRALLRADGLKALSVLMQ
jgi:hypothetical protein